MLQAGIANFCKDERGGGTIMGLFWFMVLVAFCGLAVDITDAFRSQTMLQATADSAALAAAIDLPDDATAKNTAIAYSTSNMEADEFGHVLIKADVDIGKWDADNHIFSVGAADPDAVRVRTRRSIENQNPVPVNFLRIIGLFSWNVTTYAIAQRFIPDCLTDGLIARGIVDISSNNRFVNEMCIHGQKGVHMQNHNYHEPGVRVTMPNRDMLVIPTGGMESNTGLHNALGENSLDPRMVNHTTSIIGDVLSGSDYVMPSYIDGSQPVIVKDEKYNFVGTVPGRIYHIQCAANKTVGIPNNTVLANVAIISDCQIGVGSNVTMTDVLLASRAGGNPGVGSGDNSNAGGNGKKSDGPPSGGGGAGTSNANITFASNVNLGRPDGCQPGGGVQIFSNASVKFSSSMTMNGVQIVAAGDVDLGARDKGINGINVQAGGNITLTSNNAFGICSGGAPSLFTVNYYRLVF